MERYELPDGWEWSTLGESCLVNSRDPALKELPKDTTVSFVPMAAVDAEQGVIASPVDRPFSEVRKGFTPFSDGDVIFAKITPSMENGKAAIASELTNGFGFGSTEFHVMRPKESVIAEWVFHFIRQRSFRDEAKASFTGTAGQMRVPEKFILDSDIPLPPLPEQQRIIKKIESLFEQSRAARAALTRVPVLMSQFRRAVLASAFRGELVEPDQNDEPAASLLERVRTERRRKWENDLRANGKDPAKYKYKEPKAPDISKLPELPDGWVWANVEMLASDEPHSITDGPFGSNLKTVDYVLQGVRVIRLQNIGVIEFKDRDKSYISPTKFETLSKHEVKAGDVIIAALADPVGRACIVPENLGQAIVKADCIKLNVDTRLANNKYVLYALNNPDHFERASELAHGVGRLRANLSDVKSFVVPLAPLSEQRHIVDKIEALFAQADIIEQAASVSLRRAEQVDQSILARAFHGELVR